MGDVIREEAEKQGLSPTAENIGKVAVEIRQKEGADVVARRCIEKMRHIKSDSSILAIDGVRSMAEVETFRRSYQNVVLIAVHSSPQTRFQRFLLRHRSDDADNWELFKTRDLRELGFGIGGAIAMADRVIINESTAEDLKKRSKRIIEECLAQWTN
jgi:dephospho-CoA kinase